MPDIVKQIFGEYGFTDFRFQLSGTYEPREYCVQYRETDFDFVARLLEEEGIFFFFEHEDGKHTLVLADSPRAHEPCPVLDRVRFMHEQVSPARGGRRHLVHEGAGAAGRQVRRTPTTTSRPRRST